MSFFTRSGDLFTPTPGRENLLETLPVGNYIVVETMTGLKFQKVDSFKAPGRIYGNLNDRADRILHTFEDRPRTTGVLLEGEKGSGKSQLARVISLKGYEQGIPTIIINSPWCGDGFNALLATIEQPAIILMDEFEKVYNQRESQEQVLTLLDGLMTSKKLFVMTVNNKYAVNEHMNNRPGRIFYALRFSGLEPAFVREYCEENLEDSDQIENVLKIGSMFKAFNFDMLKALVEEMNRYKEDAFDAMELLNAKPVDIQGHVTYEVQATSPNGLVSNVTEVTELPMTTNNNALYLSMNWKDALEEAEDSKAACRDIGIQKIDFKEGDTSRNFVVQSKELKKIDAEAGNYLFHTHGFSIAFTRKKEATYNIRDWASY